MTAAVNLIQLANVASRFEVIDMFECEGLVFSMFDGSGYAALPWAKAGYKVVCFNADEGDHGSYQSVRVTHPNISYVNAWIDEDFKVSACNLLWGKPDFVMAFPPCTDWQTPAPATGSARLRLIQISGQGGGDLQDCGGDC
ncbi:hypothetical protein [Enterobacter phage N5822]|nr:hypothetical protein [Enterobacter phage N5822]